MTGIQLIHAERPPDIPGITGGPFGNSTQVGQFQLRDGRVINASNVNIAFPTGSTPIGAAGGDLSGSYPNPSIKAAAVTQDKINSGQALAGQVLSADGSGGANWSDPTSAPVTASLFNAEVNGEIILDSSITPDTEVAAVHNLMPGNYTLMASALVLMNGQPTLVRCNLNDENGFITVAAATVAPVSCFLNGCFANMTLLSVRQDPGDVSLKCSRLGDNTSSAKVSSANLVATKVGSITCTGNGCQAPPNL